VNEQRVAGLQLVDADLKRCEWFGFGASVRVAAMRSDVKLGGAQRGQRRDQQGDE
jgi:hypothetical protein